MKIILVNKFYYRRGGAESYLLDLEKKLLAEGHDVAVFSMHHPKNEPSPWAKYFVSRISFHESGLWSKLKSPFRLLYSFEAKRKFEALVNDFKPDIIHIHNIYHQISPSILPVAKKHGIPAVMHLHDYKLICPNYQMFDRGEICYDCAAPNYYRCVSKRCMNGSLSRSIGATLEMYVHHSLLKIYEKNIDGYIAPSNFMKTTCVRFGVPAERISVLYNFISSSAPYTGKLGNYVAYIGRLSPEKGIDVLIKALALASSDLVLEIAGEGPDRSRLEKLVQDTGMQARVHFTGRLSGGALDEVIDRARAIVIPSVWLENMPFSALEAMAKGKLVIASNIGGLGELIKDQESGLAFPSADEKALAHILNNIDDDKAARLGAAARQAVAEYTIDNHYKKLMEIFRKYVH